MACRVTVVRFSRVPHQSVVSAIGDRIATITLNRPDKLNALNRVTITELGEAVAAARTDPAVGAIILTGAGRAFAAGADISELRALSAVNATELSARGQAVFRAIETSPKPVIAAVNGFAFGGGCELAMACHIRIAAAEGARFAQPEVKLGLIPGYGGTQRLPRLVGAGRALHLLLTGETIHAEEAFTIGLVTRVVPDGELHTAARNLAKHILSNGPLAIALTIDAVHRGQGMSIEDGLTLESAYFGTLAASADAAEGTSAFLEKRAATFAGR
jgi:enoyl-CoA hydratase